MNTEKLFSSFSYGTLQYEKIQEIVFDVMSDELRQADSDEVS